MGLEHMGPYSPYMGVPGSLGSHGGAQGRLVGPSAGPLPYFPCLLVPRMGFLRLRASLWARFGCLFESFLLALAESFCAPLCSKNNTYAVPRVLGAHVFCVFCPSRTPKTYVLAVADTQNMCFGRSGHPKHMFCPSRTPTTYVWPYRTPKTYVLC